MKELLSFESRINQGMFDSSQYQNRGLSSTKSQSNGFTIRIKKANNSQKQKSNMFSHLLFQNKPLLMIYYRLPVSIGKKILCNMLSLMSLMLN